MDEFRPMWSGRLMVGMEDMGPAVIWSLYNIPIPPINGKLEMTCMAEYDDLWINILESEQHNLSWNSLRFIRGKTVSVFTITSHTPQFLQLTQELIQTQKPRILTGEVINPEQLIEIVLVPHCPELQNLGLKGLSDSIQPSLLIIFVSTPHVKSTFDREESIHQFTQVYGDVTSSNMPKKNMMVGCSEIKNKSEQKHEGNKKSDKKKGSKSCERKRREVHTRIGEPRKCKGLGTTNLVKFTEIKEEKVVKMHEKHYSENNKELENNGISAKGCVGPEECLEKATALSHVDRVKDFGKNMNNIVCADKAACNISSEICLCKNFDLKDKQTVVAASASGKPSSEEQQPSGSDKTNMLDIKKFNEFFFSKDTNKPDLIKPSMLKKNSKKNYLKGNIKHSNSSQEESDNDCVIPDLKNCEILDKKSNRKNEKRPLKRREDRRSHSSGLPKDLLRNSTNEFTAMLQRNDKKSEEKEKQEETENKDVVKSEVKNVEMNFSPCQILSDKTCVIAEGKETLKERETDLDNSQFPSSWTSELLETDVNQQTAKLRDSVSLGQFEMKFTTNHDMREEKMNDICSKTKTNKVKSLIANFGLKRKPDETKKAVEYMCSPRKKALVILKDIMKGSDKIELSRLLHSQKLEDISNKTCFSKEVIEPIYHMDPPQPSFNHKTFKNFTDFKSRNVCGIGSLQESCKRKDTEQSANEFQQLSFVDRAIDHVKEQDSVKQESSLECNSDMNAEEKRSKTRVKVHALRIGGFHPDTIDLQTELSELQGVQDHPLDLSFRSFPSQPCNLKHPESDMRLSVPDREVTKPVDYMDPSLTSSYPKMLKKNRAFENKDFKRERSLQENCKRKGIEQCSDKLECTFANYSLDKMCFIDHIKEPASLRQELLLDCNLSVNEDEKSEISIKENGRDSVFDAIEVKTQMNEIAHSDCFPQLFLQEQPECQRILNSSQFGIDIGTKEINEEMHLHNLPNSTVERLFVDLFLKTVAVDAGIPSVSTETVLLDCITAVPSLDPKDKEKSSTSNQFLTKPSLPPLSSLNSYAVEKTMNLFSETPKLNHLQKLRQFEKSVLLCNESSYLSSEVLKKQKSVNKIYELITGLMENRICKEGWLMQNNEDHPIDTFNIPCSIERTSPGIHIPTGAAKEMIRSKSVNSHDFRSESNRSSITLSHSPGFNTGLFKQKECDVESLFQKINIKIQAYVLALTSYDTHNHLHGGIKTLADFIETSTTTNPNIKCTAPVTDSSSIEDQEGRLVTSSQQLKMFIIQQLTKLHVPYRMENLIMTPHYSSEVDALCICQKSRHLCQHFKQIECQNGTVSAHNMIEYFLEHLGVVRGNSVSSCKGLNGKYQSFAECLTSFTSNQQIDLCQGRITPKIIVFTPNDIYQPSWKESHPCKLDEGLQVQRYIHLFKADQQDVVKLKCLSVVHDMSYASLEEIERHGGNIYIRPSAVDHLLAHPVLANIYHLSHVQFGVYNSLITVLNGGAKPILKSKWLLLVHHTALVDESFVKILQEVLRNEDFSSHHHDCVFIPILTLKTCINILENSLRRMTREQELCDILQRNINMLIQCIMVGVVHIIDGESYWASLSPESPFTDFLIGLKVIHRCLQFVHRHSAVLVGDSLLNRNKTVENSFYRVCTVTDIMNANFGS